ncbi:MAG: hypothetical protein ACREIF_08150 [Chthoniobacterales bacterium]
MALPQPCPSHRSCITFARYSALVCFLKDPSRVNDSNKPRLPQKTGFNLLVGMIVAIAVVAFVAAMVDRPLVTPLLTTGVLALVVAVFLALFRANRRKD